MTFKTIYAVSEKESKRGAVSHSQLKTENQEFGEMERFSSSYYFVLGTEFRPPQAGKGSVCPAAISPVLTFVVRITTLDSFSWLSKFL